MRTFHRVGAGVLVLLGLGLAGCSKTIQVGALISQTGAAAGYGDKVKKGLDLACDEINAEGGFGGKTFELIYRDDQTSARVGQAMTAELIADFDVGIIIGAVSSPVTLAISPMCEEEKVVLLSPTASAPQITHAGQYIFRNHPSDILEGTAMANFARDLGLERVAIFAVDNEYGAGLEGVFSEKFKSKFREIVEVFRFEEGEAGTQGPSADHLKELNPGGVYIVGYLADVAMLVKSVRDAGLDSVILTSSSVTPRDLVQMVGAAAEDVIYPKPTTFDLESEEQVVRDFIEAYRARYQEEPDNFAAHGYDAMKLLRLAMEKGESTHPDDVKIGLLSIDNHRGASGRLAFDQNGDVVQYPRLFIIRQGRATPYDRFIEEGGSLRMPQRE